VYADIGRESQPRSKFMMGTMNMMPIQVFLWLNLRELFARSYTILYVGAPVLQLFYKHAYSIRFQVVLSG